MSLAALPAPGTHPRAPDAGHRARLAPCFRRPEARQRAAAYLDGLLGDAQRKNGWQLAETAGDATPYGLQHLLGQAVWWLVDAARDALYAYVAEHLRAPEGVVVVDETGFPKKGTHSAGVVPQYCGTLGKVGNCQVGVFLAYIGFRGHTRLDRELYLTEDWTRDPDRLQAVGLAPNTPFATKPQLARRMLARTLDAGLPMAWVVGDTVYGHSRALRSWLEDRGLHHVLAVPRNEELWAGTDLRRVDEVQAVHREREWHRLSAGAGSKGERWYDWQCWILAEPEDADWGHYLLFRRSVTDAEDWQAYVAFAPQGCELETLVAVAGRRWCIEHAFETAKQETGLDDYEVRSAHGWYRHVTLALWALALLAVVRAAWPGPEPAGDPAPPVAPSPARAARGAAGAGLAALAPPSPVGGPGLPLPPATAPIATNTTVVLGILRARAYW